MKLYCKGEYHHAPMNLHFTAPGIIEIDDPKAEFLLRDAPENFSRELPAGGGVVPVAKAIDAPMVDKQLKAPAKKK